MPRSLLDQILIGTQQSRNRNQEEELMSWPTAVVLVAAIIGITAVISAFLSTRNK